MGVLTMWENLAHAIAEARKDRNTQYQVGYTPIQSGEYFQRLAEEGYGQQGLRDLLMPQMQTIQNQYMNQRDQFIGGIGKRGLYDSGIKERGMAGLIGARQGAIGSVQSNLWKQNQALMLEGQKTLEDVRRFNAQNQFQADQFNISQKLQYDVHQEQMRMQQAMLDEQRRQAQGGFWGGLTGLGAGIMQIPGLGLPIGGAIAGAGLIGLATS